jgi:hypothetical protein
MGKIGHINSEAYLEFLEDELRFVLSRDNERYEGSASAKNVKFVEWVSYIPAYLLLIVALLIYCAFMPLFLLGNFVKYVIVKSKGLPFKFELPPPVPAKMIDLVDNKIKIEIRHNEHAPPHFHMIIDDNDCSFNIMTGELLNGTPDNIKILKKINKWYSKNKSSLIKVWNATRPSDCPVGKIN